MEVTMTQVNVGPSEFERLNFVVLAPETSISNGRFKKYMTGDPVRSKVGRRISEYEPEYMQILESWFDNYFELTLKHVGLANFSWEKSIGWVGRKKLEVDDGLSEFYDRCLEFN